ncbi:hypothetical protein NDU88_009919 [Pleurodeles waltl]|uniref:Uncharacterized protein n=1 Tax=Pleurodeles waltl TaxID=8319 RepID=A0AAV7S136_PLEWA|nr:hypothetical protein NDU88_009919 [Pleurodeles waltl]
MSGRKGSSGIGYLQNRVAMSEFSWRSRQMSPTRRAELADQEGVDARYHIAKAAPGSKETAGEDTRDQGRAPNYGWDSAGAEYISSLAECEIIFLADRDKGL